MDLHLTTDAGIFSRHSLLQVSQVWGKPMVTLLITSATIVATLLALLLYDDAESAHILSFDWRCCHLMNFIGRNCRSWCALCLDWLDKDLGDFSWLHLEHHHILMII